MKCLVCGNDHVDKKTGECPDCGFELVSWTGSGNQDEYLAIMEEMAKDYREEIRKEISVELLVPSYEQTEDGSLTMKSEDPIVLTGGKREPSKTVKWYPERFARMDPGEPVTLRLSVKRSQGADFKKEVELISPDWGSCFWRIGILEEAPLHFRLVLGAEGDEGKCLKSELISMVGRV